MSRIAPALALAALAAAGCHTTRPVPAAPAAPQPEVAEATVDRVPHWLTQPPSQEQMREIETWLAVDGPHSAPLWRIEGELRLNLARLEFAQRDANQKSAATTGGDSVPARLRTARAGLEQVMGDIDATSAQRRRAHDGMARADKLLAQSAPSRMIGVPVIARAAWGAAQAHAERMDKNKNGYTRITVHHSADPNPVALDGSSAKSYEAVREIQKAHMDGKNTHYGDIGYHFVIDPYGRVIEGRDLTYQGAHAYGDNNIQNIGICLIGNFDEEQPTKAALDALRREIDTLRQKYGIPKDQVFGHREMRSTECPGKNLMKWIEQYRGSEAVPAAKKSTRAHVTTESTASARTAAARHTAKAPLPVHLLH